MSQWDTQGRGCISNALHWVKVPDSEVYLRFNSISVIFLHRQKYRAGQQLSGCLWLGKGVWVTTEEHGWGSFGSRWTLLCLDNVVYMTACVCQNLQNCTQKRINLIFYVLYINTNVDSFPLIRNLACQHWEYHLNFRVRHSIHTSDILAHLSIP